MALDGAANSGPGLGAIAFDTKSRRLFVSDLQTGMIHAFDLSGREVARYDHGTQGRARQGLNPVAFDPSARTPITSPAFQAARSHQLGFRQQGAQGVGPRRVRWAALLCGGRRPGYLVSRPDLQWRLRGRCPGRD